MARTGLQKGIKKADTSQYPFLIFFIGRSDWVRTSDLYVPNVALYQAELHSENDCIFTRRCRLCNEQVEKAISFISLLYL